MMDDRSLKDLIQSHRYQFTLIDHMGPSSRYLSLVDDNTEHVRTLARFKDEIEGETISKIVTMLNRQADRFHDPVIDLSVDDIRSRMEERGIDLSGMADVDLRVFVEERLRSENVMETLMEEVEFQLNEYFGND
jgi:hypothetical protein